MKLNENIFFCEWKQYVLPNKFWFSHRKGGRRIVEIPILRLKYYYIFNRSCINEIHAKKEKRRRWLLKNWNIGVLREVNIPLSLD
jgi:hypothetical protein